ncbi:hypothetical protein F5Y13DRAFT_164110, partial [Hypoxylon sp. FL1857]
MLTSHVTVVVLLGTIAASTPLELGRNMYKAELPTTSNCAFLARASKTVFLHAFAISYRFDRTKRHAVVPQTIPRMDTWSKMREAPRRRAKVLRAFDAVSGQSATYEGLTRPPRL